MLGIVINGTRIGQGKENVRQFLNENPKIMQELEKTIRDNLINKSTGPVHSAEVEEAEELELEH